MNAGSYRFDVGGFACVALSDGSFTYPVESLFANVPQAESHLALRQHYYPVTHVTTPYTCLLIDTGTHRVLIDTGAGNLGAHAATLFPTVDHSTTRTGTLVANMQAIGLYPRDIDIIIITHAHPDHIGGTLDTSDGLVFANAEYVMHQAEWTFWTSEAAVEQAAPAMVQIARHNLIPLANRLTCIEQEEEIVPGIRAIATPGHTPGHIAVAISSRGETLLHIADVALSPLHLEHPTWVPVFDMDPAQAATSKRSICDRAASEQALVFAHHFPPFPNLGYILPHEVAWRWEPLAIERALQLGG